MATAFDRIADWLQRVSLVDATLEDLVAAFGDRLVDGGVPVARISLGRLLLHPVIGVIDVTWDAGTGRVSTEVLPRSAIKPALLMEGPFGETTKTALEFAESVRHLRGLEVADAIVDVPDILADLTDPDIRDRYPVYRRLAAAGMTGYVAFSAPFGVEEVSFADGSSSLAGASVSYATKRRSGFSDADIAGFRQVLLPLMIAVRVSAERFFAAELLEAYLGRISGRSVLNGQIARGDVRRIDCALLFSDMHGSTALSLRLPPEDYVARVNRYFDCVGEAVLEHGGEVPKFIGDGLLAIFPFDGVRRLPEDMCAAALSAAREAFH